MCALQAALVHLDPPCPPPRDEACLCQALHVLAGLARVVSRPDEHVGDAHAKLRKRLTASGSRRTVRAAPDRLFEHFHAPATLVVSDGSDGDLGAGELEALPARRRRTLRRIGIPHRCAFRTHPGAGRRLASECVFVAS
jgi:hypothetical protein